MIPAFNEEKYIKGCLESIISQNVSPYEIIVVDNNSTDKTIKIVKNFKVRLVKEKTQGMIPARNRGFNEAKGDIIARIDADTIAPRDWIKKITENFNYNNIDALSGPISYSGSHLVTTSPIPSKVFLESLRIFTKGKRFMLGPNMSLTKEVWSKVKNIVNQDETKVNEDIDLSLKIIAAGGVIGYDPNLIVKSSARRIVGNPKSFFVEYTLKTARSIFVNKQKNNH